MRPAHVSVMERGRGQGERYEVSQVWNSEGAGRTDMVHVEQKMKSRLRQIWGSAFCAAKAG